MGGGKMNDHIPDPTKMISDTPISDSTPHNVADLAMLCRRLERELNAANEMFQKLNVHSLNLTDHIRRLKEAGDAMEKLLPEDCICDKIAIRWIKTKDDKL
jgi:hypothetical protein